MRLLTLWHRAAVAWRSIAPRRYTQMLESEIARLHLENRALLNSILGVAGLPPITVPTLECAPGPASSSNVDDSSGKTTNHKPTSLGRPRPSTLHKKLSVPAQVTSPTRRRSWHQITQLLELKSAKKSEETAS